MNGLAVSLDFWSVSPAHCEQGTLLFARSKPAKVSEPSSTAEAADIQAALGGDGDAYARLVRRHQDAIGRMMWRFTRNPREWEELVHDVFVEAYFSLAGFRQRAPFEHWLKRIATRAGYRFWKQQQRNRQTEALLADPASQTSNQAHDANEAAELVCQLLAQLAPRDRLVMTLSYLENKTVAEIADLVGWSKTMVKVQTHRARLRLAKICQAQGIEL